MSKLKYYAITIKGWFSRNSANIAFTIIVLVLFILAVEIVATQKQLTEQTEQRDQATQQILTATKANTDSLIETTERQTVLICALNRIANDVEDLTDEQRQEIEEICEQEIERFESEQSDGSVQSDQPASDPQSQDEPKNKPDNSNKPDNGNGSQNRNNKPENEGDNSNNPFMSILDALAEMI